MVGSDAEWSPCCFATSLGKFEIPMLTVHKGPPMKDVCSVYLEAGSGFCRLMLN